jgi:hypothetical protein
VIVDTSALLAFFNSTEPQHSAVRKAIEDNNEALIVSPYVIAELDYRVDAELAVLRELTGGAWELGSCGAEDVVAAGRVIERYRDQAIGLADAANVVLADRYGTRTIATLDHRHFDVLRPLRGGRFRIVP